MEEETFIMYDENGQEKEGIVISVIEVLGQEYVIYGVEEDNDNYNVFVSRLEKDNNGDGQIIPITDKEEKDRVNDIVLDLLKEGY